MLPTSSIITLIFVKNICGGNLFDIVFQTRITLVILREKLDDTRISQEEQKSCFSTNNRQAARIVVIREIFVVVTIRLGSVYRLYRGWLSPCVQKWEARNFFCFFPA